MDAYQSANPQATVKPFNVLRGVADYRFRVILVVILSMLAGLTLILVQTPVYESRATLFVKFGREQVYRPEVGPDSPPVVPATTDPDETIMTQLQLFSSRDVIVKTIDQIGLYRLYPELAPNQPQEGMFDRSAFGQRLQQLYAVIVPRRSRGSRREPRRIKQSGNSRDRCRFRVRGHRRLFRWHSDIGIP